MDGERGCTYSSATRIGAEVAVRKPVGLRLISIGLRVATGGTLMFDRVLRPVMRGWYQKILLQTAGLQSPKDSPTVTVAGTTPTGFSLSVTGQPTGGV